RASIDPYVSIFFTGHAAADLYPLPLHDALPICAVAACRYPPRGRRGFGPRRMSSYGRQGGAEYVRAADASLLVSVQIETTEALADRKSTRLNSSHSQTSYAVFCLKKKKIWPGS